MSITAAPGSPTPTSELLDDARRRAVRYLDSLGDRGVAASPTAVERLADLREPLPAGPTDPAAVLALLDEYVSPATIATAGPRFFGFVIGGSLPATLAATWLAAAWDQNAALAKVTPGVALLEDVALGWLVDLLGLPAGTEGSFITGATVANFTALAAARHAVLADVGWNVEADGLFGAPPITVVIGDEAHPTLLKSLGLLGLGRTRLVRVPVDAQGRFRADAFPKIRAPAILCLQAGNINTGAFDPFAEVIPRAH
jgi:glutamate/tyrosine decarboxylase-like PLP-dependent enzyme